MAQPGAQDGAGRPAASAQTNATKGSVRDVKVTAKRKVTYVFDTSATSSTLKIPYCVAVNGDVVLHKDKPGRIVHNQSFSVTVDAGSEVSLYLNSDAHPSRRTQAVYKVTPNERDIYVTVTEKTGKSADADTPVFKKTEGQVDKYTAPLTGDIWMKVSYKYTKADAEALIPASADAGVRTAVLDIYNELKGNTLSIACAAPAGRVVTVKFNDSDNPKSNINNYELKRDGLTRVHPLGFFALFDAAREAACSQMTMSSCWRPLLGSIAHRAGLGLDVSYLEDSASKVTVNRQELVKKGAADYAWVTDEEKRLYGVYQAAKPTATKAAADLKAAEAAVAKAKNDPVALTAATKARDAARTRKAEADKALADAKSAWNTERDAHEPSVIKSFRTQLAASAHIKQLFDPWMMDENTRDAKSAAANEQKSSNETLHAHHLHITVAESELL